MARPREFSDELIFYGVYSALCKKGYAKFTLTDIANEINSSTAALSKRFASKKGILLAYSDYVIQITKTSFEEAKQNEPSSISAIKTVFKNAVKLANDPVSLANHTSFFLEITSDDDLLEKSRQRLKLIDEETTGLLETAMKNNEIKKGDAALISTVLQCAVSGAILIWIRDSDKTLDELLDDCFRVVLEPLSI